VHIEIRRICVPTDFSDPADWALRYGAQLAKTFSAELHLLHVLQDFAMIVSDPEFAAAAVSVGDFLQNMQKDANANLDKISSQDWLRATGQSQVIKAVRNGTPAEEICRYARKNDIDLVVCGTHGRTGIKHLLLGSVAERVIRVSPCPVLTVRHPQHDFIVGDDADKMPIVE
jgi:nucleotide-binding universal stress UspA family protein